jgi:hypothetical protein
MESERQAQLGQQWIVRSLWNKLLGREGRCMMHFVSASSRELGEFLVGKGLDDYSKHEMLVIPVEQLLSAQSQLTAKPGPTHLHRRNSRRDLIADASTALDTSNTAHSTSTLRRRSSSVPNIQMPLAPPQPTPLTPQRNIPQMYAAERVHAAVQADKSIRVNAAARSLGASEAGSNETLKLMLEEMAARVQASEKEILFLKEALMQKDNVISALECSNAFLIKERVSIAELAPSAAAPVDAPPQLASGIQRPQDFQQSQSDFVFEQLQEIQQESDAAIQGLEDDGATPEEISETEESTARVMAANGHIELDANAGSNTSNAGGNTSLNAGGNTSLQEPQAASPDPPTPSPKLKTSAPKPQTTNPKPQPPNSKLQPLNAKPQTNLKPLNLNPKPQAPSPKPQTTKPTPQQPTTKPQPSNPPP